MNEDLFYANVNLVFRIVKRMENAYVEKDDLIQAGLIGLNQATKTYNKEKGASFTTYATYFIMGEIKKEIRNNRSIKLSKEVFRTLRKLKKIDDNLSIDELCELLSVDREIIILALNYKENIISLNKEKDDLELINLVPDKKQFLSFEVLHNLDKISQEVILLKYFKGYTQKDIARIMNISQSKVSRLEALALKRIKSSL